MSATPAPGVAPPTCALDPLPPLDWILPVHIAYVRKVVARFSVTPAHWREDLIQEILLEAHRSRCSPLDVRALLCGITRHMVFRWMRMCGLARRAELAALTLGSCPRPEVETARTAEDDRAEAERRTAIQTAIGELPAIFREILIRVEIEGQAMPDATRCLGIPLNTGYTRLHIARARLRESLRRFLLRCHIAGEDLL